jgi:hypothetical protein
VGDVRDGQSERTGKAANRPALRPANAAVLDAIHRLAGDARSSCDFTLIEPKGSAALCEDEGW